MKEMENLTARGPCSGSEPRAKGNSSSSPCSACNVSSSRAGGRRGMDEGRRWAGGQETLVGHYDREESYYKTHVYLFCFVFIPRGCAICTLVQLNPLSGDEGPLINFASACTSSGRRKKSKRACMQSPATLCNEQQHEIHLANRTGRQEAQQNVVSLFFGTRAA